MSQPVIAVYDIGRTNKKLLLYNQEYEVVYQDQASFPEIEDDDGYPCDDLDLVCQWVKKSFKNVKKNRDFDIRALNVSAYGASFVHLDERGNPVTPLYNYLKPYPEELSQQLYDQYGGEASFAQQTSSPPMGMLNSGLQLYWLKYKKPEVYQKIWRSLHLPQFFAYLIHGKFFNEITSLGCHTALWDFANDRGHDWVYDEKITAVLPPVVATHSYEEVSNKNKNILCGVGIHDSSASLVPYMLGIEESFMLLSSGTWNITLNPFNDEPLTEEELHQDCLQYINYRGVPVKASRIFMGSEHNAQETRLAEYFNKSPDYHCTLVPDEGLIRKLLSQGDPARRFYPQTMQHTGPFPNLNGPLTDLSLFSNYEEAYHQLLLDLVGMQAVSLKLAKGTQQPEKVFISGGFCDNALFMQLLASYFPKMKFYTTELSNASALGAALVMHRHWNREQSIDHLFSFQKVTPLVLPTLSSYPLARV
uniref:FGGY family carbohydrate kinase n=1 Tax=Roseihalotalea indica TaxID=2867963 RepID=A0AA49JFC5_9BACT|nr:FGGY family carbohydrate kinase [Tunicatimonas sp. TK19036]